MKSIRLVLILLSFGFYMTFASPATWAEVYWAVDSATGCKIGAHDRLIAATWTGPIVNGYAEGKGIYTFTALSEDGKEIQVNGEGEMIAGLLDGKVTNKYSDGKSYEGYYKSGLRNGKGVMTYSEGTTYDGEWKDGKRDGFGTIKAKDGSVYVGSFKNGLYNGKGIMTYSDGSTYDGEWKDGKQDGTGTYMWMDGRVFVGSYKYGAPNGKGIMTYSDGSTYDGEWKDSKRDGTGTYTYKWPNGQVYIGGFKNNQRNGKGILTYSDGSTYDGGWKDDKRDGIGIFKGMDGVYVGSFKNGSANGKGILTYSDGSTYYDGEWKDGKPDRTGTTWIELIYDRDVPQKTRENIAKAVDATADVLTKYNIVLPYSITLVVTADRESFIQALMLYGKQTRAMAEENERSLAGTSLSEKHMIILKGTPRLNNNPEEALRVFPHEVFHQVQTQYWKYSTFNWLKEGAPELFQFMVNETAGFGNVDAFLRLAKENIRRASEIPDAQQLASNKYADYTSLAQKGYPVYHMSVIMTARLVQEHDFKNIIFFYQLLHNGTDPDKAFVTAFQVPMASFLSDMNAYFNELRAKH